jgi:hypothetical protein
MQLYASRKQSVRVWIIALVLAVAVMGGQIALQQLFGVDLTPSASACQSHAGGGC